MEEIWKPIQGYEGHYEISNLGNVKSLAKVSYRKTGSILKRTPDKILKQNNHSDGYKFVFLFKKNFLVHRLVALHFLDVEPDKKYVNHIDGNKHNNCVSNLEWCTSSHNQAHAYKIGLRKSLLSDDDKIKILTLRKSGLTYPKIAEQFNVSQQRIALICKQYEIEMEVADLAFYENGNRYLLEADIPTRFKYTPKLDSSGCLILTKKI